ncbi:MAG: sulfotransferase [Pseudomonadota bacterium]
MAEPRVMLCVGATKAGTSWLHRALSGHSEVHFRAIKELHYFDSLENGAVERRMAEVSAQRDRLVARRAEASLLKRRRLAAPIADHEAYLALLGRGSEDVPGYLAYLAKGRGRAQIVGDATPAYGLLPVERLRAMARMAADVRFVYLLRDPVERLWSHIRMMAVRRSGDGQIDRARADRILARTIRGEERQIVIRSDYRGALERLKAAVDPARLFTGFYEDLFEGAGFDRICDFLGIARADASFAVVNRGQPLDMRPEQRRAARDWLADQYDYVSANHGPVPARWMMNSVEV